MDILLVDIGDYYISGYYEYWWILVAITLMAIMVIGGYW
jgi:hypothetical protein